MHLPWSFTKLVLAAFPVTGPDQDQVLTGGPPFARRGKAELICKVVLGDGWPPRPRDSGKLGFTDEVWESLLICWRREPSARSSINAVSTCLKQAAESWVADVPAFMFASEAGVEHVMNLKESQAQDFADMLDKVPHKIRRCSDGSSDSDASVSF